MHIKVLRMRWEVGGYNYCFLVSTEDKTKSWIFDPGEPLEIIPQLTDDEISSITTIVNTHHHYGHSGGNTAIATTVRRKTNRNISVLANSNLSFGVTENPAHLQKFTLNDIEFIILKTPCHTQDSLTIYAIDTKTNQRALITGDTILNAGCGTFLEGTSDEMYNALYRRILENVGKDNFATTMIYPGHERTRDNIEFIRKNIYRNKSDNKAFDDLEKFALENEQVAGYYSLLDELSYNPYLRIDDPFVRIAIDDPHGFLSNSKVISKIKQLENKKHACS